MIKIPATQIRKIRKSCSIGTYVGRRTKYQAGSKFGNPYVIGIDGTREQVIERYIVHLFNSGLIYDVENELKGHTLSCWCAPELCHAEFLWLVANNHIDINKGIHHALEFWQQYIKERNA